MTLKPSTVDPLADVLPPQTRQHPLIKEALTHVSVKGECHNERLEFLGDAVIGLIVSQWLYTHRPGETEGAMSHLRASLVQRRSLAAAAKSIGLGRALRMSQGAREAGGHYNPRLLCGALEALIGAIYQIDGPDTAQEVFNRIMAKHYRQLPGNPELAKDSKNLLQELTQRLGLGRPTYRLIETPDGKNPDHQSLCLVAGSEATVGIGRTRRASEKDAAAKMMTKLKARDPAPESADPDSVMYCPDSAATG